VFFQVPDAPRPVFGPGSAPDPCEGAYDTPPDSCLAGELSNMSWIFLKIPPEISWKFA